MKKLDSPAVSPVLRARVFIDDQVLEIKEGVSILEAVREKGIDLPALCHDSRMKPANSCRACRVTVSSPQGASRDVCACSTPIQEGMRIQTHTPSLEAFRKELFELYLKDYPKDALTNYPEKPFHRYAQKYAPEFCRSDANPSELPTCDGTDHGLVETTHPYIRVDMSRCIRCYRCVHICESLQGQFVWKVMNRGDRVQIVPDSNTTLLESTCVSCGACVDTCPSGALEDVARVEVGTPDRVVHTTCPYCGVGCELAVGVKDDRVIESRPVLDSPVSRGHLCVKGRYSTGFIDATDRVLHPMVRRDGSWVQVSWDEALDAAALALTEARDRSGPDSIGVLGSARGTNEDAYLAQKFSRVVLGTNNVDCCARVCHGPSAAGLAMAFGTGAATNSFNDVERTQAFLVIGTNTTENHPIVGARIRQRVLAGVPLVVIDPRRTELARIANVHLMLRPGTNLPLFNAMAKLMIDEGWIDRKFIENRTSGFEAFVKSLEPWTLERAAEICGLEPAKIRAATEIYARTRPAMCLHGLGVTEHIQGTDSVSAIAHLAMLTGNLGIPGAGVNPLRGQNNVQGAANMGCEPKKLTGYQPIDSARKIHQEVWGVPVPTTAGIDFIEMLDAAQAGKLKSMLVIGYDILLTSPNAHATVNALGKLDSMVIVDLFMTETAKKFGTVFLPTTSSFEKSGTFMNSERRIQRVRQAISTRGDTRNDSDIILQLAERMGFKRYFNFDSPEAVWNEIREVWPAAKGISYARIEKTGIQWPCPSEDHPGTEVLHSESFPIGPRATFRPIDWRPSTQQVSVEYPLVLNTGRSLFHFNAATMTGRTRNSEIRPVDLLEIHPEDAAEYGITEKSRVCVQSAFGSFEARASLTPHIRRGELFTTFHNVEAMINHATGKGRDSYTHTPEFKVTAVTIRGL